MENGKTDVRFLFPDATTENIILYITDIIKVMKKNKNHSAPFVAFLQAVGLTMYCSLIGVLLFNSNRWFGKMNNMLGPVLFLAIFVVSAMICALITLGYPFLVFWDQKNTKKALKIVGFTAGWLVLFIFVLMILLIIF